jgi:NAD(P)-dependent dehydrogenase (short-subunit alcohol dehydrogenase family)
MKLKFIDRQSVVVVGAASGIGRNTALRFAERGALLTVTDHDEQRLQTLVEEIQKGSQ